MNKIKSQGKNSIYKHSPIKRNQFSDTLKNKKIGIFKPFNEKLLTPHEIKKINCLTQYK